MVRGRRREGERYRDIHTRTERVRDSETRGREARSVQAHTWAKRVRMIHENKKMQVQTPTREVGACTHMHHMWCSTATLLNAPHVVLSPEHHA